LAHAAKKKHYISGEKCIAEKVWLAGGDVGVAVGIFEEGGWCFGKKNRGIAC